MSLSSLLRTLDQSKNSLFKVETFKFLNITRRFDTSFSVSCSFFKINDNKLLNPCNLGLLLISEING